MGKIQIETKFIHKGNSFRGGCSTEKKRFPVSKPFIWYIFGIFWCWIQNAGTQNETPMQIYPLLFTRPVKGIEQLMTMKGEKTKASRFHENLQF